MTSFIGHEKIFSRLTQQFESGRLPHALLLLGPEGIGKQKVALALAQKILGMEQFSQDHPDLIHVQPENERIKIDTIREIKKTLQFAPLKANTRVVLINDAHTLNGAAANALLKSLEEPPEGTYFLLITHALGWVPRTIVSRCQKFQFSPLTSSQLKKILEEQTIPLEESKLTWAQGSISQAIQLTQVQDQVPDLRSLLPSRQALSFDQAYALAQKIVDQGQTLALLQALLHATHQVLIGPRKHHQYDFDLLNFADRILEMRVALRQNINPKMNLTRLLLYFQEPKESRL